MPISLSFFFFCILLFLFASLQGTSKEIPKYSTFLVLHFYIYKKETKKRDDIHTHKGEEGGKLGGLLHCSTLHTHHQNTRLTKTR